MKKTINVVCALSIALAMVSCSSQTKKEESTDFTTLSALKHESTADTIADGTVKSVEWLPLEQSNIHVIREVTKICSVDSFILLSDKSWEQQKRMARALILRCSSLIFPSISPPNQITMVPAVPRKLLTE